MKFYQSVVIMALLGYQANAIALKYDQGEVNEYFAAEQKWTEKQDNQKEVKAAKDKLELDQLKVDTEKSLQLAREMEESKRKSDAIIEQHAQLQREKEQDPSPALIQDAEAEK